MWNGRAERTLCPRREYNEAKVAAVQDVTGWIILAAGSLQTAHTLFSATAESQPMLTTLPIVNIHP